MEHRAGVQEEFRFRDLSGEPGRALAVDGVFGAPDHGRDAGVPAGALAAGALAAGALAAGALTTGALTAGGHLVAPVRPAAGRRASVTSVTHEVG
jgi:hypothetical protein